MGSKGSQTTTQQQSQTMTPSPYVGGAGQAAIQGASYAAGQPFQMPVAPLAPFTPFQEQGFQQVQDLQGMAQPYFGMGSMYLQGSAEPVSGENVAGFYNPMASNVMAGLQDVFGQQMREATGRLTQQAGGVGAGRIPVAQANLAKQQGLAAGTTLAGLYDRALAAAQQQKQMMAGAGYGFGQMGPAAQAAQLQGTQALMGAGGQQQALSQQYLQNLYANRLAQIGYPFQTAQYLAGITGGLAPAMGGTTQGYGTTTQPAPSLGAQLLGIGAAGIGAYGAMGGFNNMGTGFGGYNPYMPWGGGSAGAVYRRGGRLSRMRSGGPPPMAPPPGPVYSPAPIGRSGEMSASIPPGGMSTEEAIAEAAPFFKYYGDSAGVPSWAKSQIGRMTTPAAFRPSPMSTLPIASGSDRLATESPFGGKVSPDLFKEWASQQEPIQLTQRYPGEGQYIYADGGGVDEEQPDISAVSMSPMGGPPVPMTGEAASVVPNIPVRSSGSGFPQLKFSSPSTGGGGGGSSTGSDIGKVADIAMKVLPMLMVKRGGRTSAGGVVNPFDVGQSFQEGGTPFADRFAGAPEDDEIDASDITLENQGLGQTPNWSPVQQNAPAMVAAGATPAAFEGDVGEDTTTLSAAPRGQYPASPFAPTMNQDMTMQSRMMPRGQMPYPGASQQDWGQRAARSPWMALVQAGAKMAQTTGPIGSVIGAGLGAAGKELEEQRKELRSEEQINQKAQALFEAAQNHLDRYQRKTPHELATEQYHEQLLARTKYAPVNIERINEKGEAETVAARFNPSTGQYEDTQTGKPVVGKLVARQTGAESATSRATRAQSAAKDDPNYMVDQLGTINKWRAVNNLAPLSASELGASRETAVPDPGEGKRIPGKWYLVNGVPRRWAE